MKRDETLSLLPGISGVGIDIIEIERIEKAVQRSGERFLQRVFTAAERSYCENKRQPHSSYAARFAAKEAVLKALGTGLSSGASFTDVEVYQKSGGAPGINLYNNTAKLAEEKGITEIAISLSHNHNQAIAVAIAQKTEGSH